MSVIGWLGRVDRTSVMTVVRGTASRRDKISRALQALNPGWICVLAGLGLSVMGVLAIDVGTALSATSPADLSLTAAKQVVFLIIGLLAAVFVALPHFRVLGLLAWPGYIIAIALLIFLLLPFVPESLVTPRNGTRGWIDLGPIDFQPSEVTKVLYVLVVARYLRYRKSHRQFLGLVVPALITLPPLALIVLQPDLGTAALFGPTLLAMLVAAGAKLRHIAIILAAVALLGPASWPVLRPHQKARIVGLIRQVQGDTVGAGDINFQSYAAQRLIGAGGTAGAGDEAARALVYFNGLPERHNDTVYAVIVARWGFAGGMLTLALYLTWVAGALLTGATTREPMGRLIPVGLATFIASQAVINVGMNLGLLPIVGITLPFISYGGSSLLTVWIMTGLVLNVGLHPARPPFRNSFEYAADDEPTPKKGEPEEPKGPIITIRRG